MSVCVSLKLRVSEPPGRQTPRSASCGHSVRPCCCPETAAAATTTTRRILGSLHAADSAKKVAGRCRSAWEESPDVKHFPRRDLYPTKHRINRIKRPPDRPGCRTCAPILHYGTVWNPVRGLESGSSTTPHCGLLAVQKVFGQVVQVVVLASDVGREVRCQMRSRETLSLS